MDTNEIRIQLLKQHAELRTIIDQTRAAARAAQGGRLQGADRLQVDVTRLARSLLAHNASEEELLKGLLVTVDAWGPVRAEIMDERHAAEHKELYGELLYTHVEPARVDQVLDRLLEHMAYEERAFLNEDVLREDSVVINAFGG